MNIILLTFSLLLMQAVNTDEPKYPYAITLPNGRTIKTELPETKAKGLMNRESLCEDCGMIFIYAKDWYYGFWMKDTLIPLAIIWIDGEGRIAHIEPNAVPCVGKQNPRRECKTYRPAKPGRFILEVNPEAAEGLAPGMKIKSVPNLK